MISTLRVLLFFLVTIFFACSSRTNNKAIQVESTSSFDEIEVYLEENIEPKMLCKEFQEYGLVSKGLSNKTLNICIFKFDTSRIDGESLLNELVKSNKVLSARLMTSGPTKISSSTSTKKGKVTIKQ